MKRLPIYCADIGSVKAGNFAWIKGVASSGGLEIIDGSKNILDLIEHVSKDMNLGLSVALGFECPFLFLSQKTQ